MLTLDDREVGYAAIKGRNDIGARDTVFEAFVVRSFRKHSGLLFREVLVASSAQFIECQSNDVFLSALLFEHATNISADVMLFADYAVTEHVVPGAVVRARRDDDHVFAHTAEPVGDYVVALDDEVVATGGFFCHYNAPFADLFMEVREDRRQRGLGSLLVQEVKRACYLAGRVPAARCSVRNLASRATLSKAGMQPCGFMLAGQLTVAPGVQ